MSENSINVNRILEKAEKLSDSRKPEESNSIIGDIIWEKNTGDEDAIILILVGRNFFTMNKTTLAKEFLWEILKMKNVSVEIQLIADKMWREYGKPVLNPTISRTGSL